MTAIHNAMKNGEDRIGLSVDESSDSEILRARKGIRRSPSSEFLDSCYLNSDIGLSDDEGSDEFYRSRVCIRRWGASSPLDLSPREREHKDSLSEAEDILFEDIAQPRNSHSVPPPPLAFRRTFRPFARRNITGGGNLGDVQNPVVGSAASILNFLRRTRGASSDQQQGPMNQTRLNYNLWQSEGELSTKLNSPEASPYTSSQGDDDTESIFSDAMSTQGEEPIGDMHLESEQYTSEEFIRSLDSLPSLQTLHAMDPGFFNCSTRAGSSSLGGSLDGLPDQDVLFQELLPTETAALPKGAKPGWVRRRLLELSHGVEA